MAKKRNRKVGSVKSELIKKSREAALAAVQIFNNPNIHFKSESYIVLMIIAWTYLLHAHYRQKKIEYRFYRMNGQRKSFDRTKHGAYKYWDLDRCISNKKSPVDKDTANNLRFLIGLRHEIEHQMTSRLDDLLSAKLQACCLNYNAYLKKLFGSSQGIENHLAFSLQLSTIAEEQKNLLSEQKDLPKNVYGYIKDFDESLSDDEYSSERFAYRILFVPKTANRKGQADKVIEFLRSDSPLAKGLNAEYAVVRETERPKYIPSQVVAKMQAEGFSRFNMHNHTVLRKQHDAQNPAKGYGVSVAGKYWHYYEQWVDLVRDHCKENSDRYK